MGKSISRCASEYQVCCAWAGRKCWRSRTCEITFRRTQAQHSVKLSFGWRLSLSLAGWLVREQERETRGDKRVFSNVGRPNTNKPRDDAK